MFHSDWTLTPTNDLSHNPTPRNRKEVTEICQWMTFRCDQWCGWKYPPSQCRYAESRCAHRRPSWWEEQGVWMNCTWQGNILVCTFKHVYSHQTSPLQSVDKSTPLGEKKFGVQETLSARFFFKFPYPISHSFRSGGPLHNHNSGLHLQSVLASHQSRCSTLLLKI